MRRVATLLRRIPVLLVGISVLASCAEEDTLGGENYPDSDGMVVFRMLVPGAVPVTTRAEGTVLENRIEDISVLVFDENSKLVKIAPGKSPAPKPGAANSNHVLWTFKADVPADADYLMAVANYPGLMSDIALDDTKNDVAKALIVSNTGRWAVSSTKGETIPMWGEITGKTISESSILEFEMTRMLARINVDATAAYKNFKLTSINYYYRNTAGYLIPSTPSVPNIPDGMNLKGPLNYYGTEYITGYETCINEIYVFEAAHKGKHGTAGWNNNPCLVIGGVYHEIGYAPSNPDVAISTYYRLDFIGKDNDGKEEWLSILRNHSYNFTITSVSGKGYNDQTTALSSAPINMEAKLIDLDGMEYIVSDGYYYLAVSHNKFEFSSDAQSDNTLTIKENDGSWSAKASGNTDGTLSVSNDVNTGKPWLSVSISGNNVIINTAQNTTASARTAYVYITSGRLSYAVTVTQLKNDNNE